MIMAFNCLPLLELVLILCFQGAVEYPEWIKTMDPEQAKVLLNPGWPGDYSIQLLPLLKLVIML